MKRLGLFVFVCIAALTASAQKANYNIIPLPKEVKTDTTQQFTLKGGMGIAYDSSNTEIVVFVFIVIELMLQIYEENPTYQHVKNVFIL